jgi:hypothetical protein
MAREDDIFTRAGRKARDIVGQPGFSGRVMDRAQGVVRQGLLMNPVTMVPAAVNEVAGRFGKGFAEGAAEPLVRTEAGGLMAMGNGQPAMGNGQSAMGNGQGARGDGIISPFARSGTVDLGAGRFSGSGGGVITPNVQRPTPNAELETREAGRLMSDAGPVRAGLALANPAGTRPIVTGSVMRRGEPGSGSYGERSDLSPMEVRRDTPMGIGEAERKGLIVRGAAAEQGPVFTDRDNRLVQSLRAGRDRSMEMTSDAAKSLRARMDARTAAAGPRSATGGNPSSSRLAKMAAAGLRFDPETRGWINVQAEDAAVRREVGLAGVDAELSGTIARSAMAQAELDRRGREFEASDANAKRGLDIQERNAGPKGLDRADDAEIAAGLAKFGKPKPMNPAELSRSDPNRWAAWNTETDPAKKAALLDEPWRDDDRLAYDNYLAEYRRRGMGGGQRTEGGGQRPAGGVAQKYGKR